LGWAFAAAVVACVLVVYQDGFASRLGTQYLALTQQQVMPRRDNGYCFYDFNNDTPRTVLSNTSDDTPLVASSNAARCVLGERTHAPKILLFGDSFAGHFEPFWDELGKANGVAINAVTTNWCVPIAGKAFDGPTSHPAHQQCMLNRRMLAQDMGKYDLIIFAGQWSGSLKAGYLPEVMQTIRKAAQAVPAVVVMPPPTRYDTNVLKRFQRSLFYQTPFDLGQYAKTRDVPEQEAYTRLRADAKELGNVIFIERDQLFPSSDTYPKAGYAMPYSLDGMHITLEGSLVAAQHFQKTAFYQQVVQPRLAHISKGPKP
jgi:hypothetical protein